VRLPRAGVGETVVGVAVTVPEPFCTQLHDARVRFGDPEARNVVPHVTLVGPTAVPDDQLGTLDAQLAAIAAAHRPFRIRLHGTQSFRPVSPVVFVTLEEGAEPCAELEGVLRVGSLEGEPLFPYHPHVTIAHDLDDAALDAAQAEMADYSATFEVTHIHRFVHDGTAWCPARRFPLGRAAADAPSTERP